MDFEARIRRIVDALRERNNLAGSPRPIILGAAADEIGLAAYEAIAPGNEQVAGVYLGLGDIARLRGDLVTAQTQLEMALNLRAAAAPGSVGVAEVHEHLVQLHDVRADLAAMRTHLDAARQIYQAQSPDAVLHAGDADAGRRPAVCGADLVHHA